jgi:predicted RND superfamily exporter protein
MKEPIMSVGYAKRILRHPRVVLVLSLIAVVCLSIGTARLEFRSDDRIFFSDRNPELSALESFEARYGREDSIVFIVSAVWGDLFTPGRLRAINQLTDRAWRLSHVKRVDSVTNFQRVTARGDEVVIDHLARSGDTLSDAQARRLKEVALGEPLLVGRLLSADAKVGLVAVQFRLNDRMSGDMAGRLMGEARELGRSFREQHPNLELRISGSLALDNAFSEASARDGALLTPVMLLVIFGLIGWIFRSSTLVFAGFLVIGAAIAGALGLAGFLRIPLSSPSVAAPFIILTLATADCIHLAAAAFRVSRVQPDLAKGAVLERALVHTLRPITMTSLTTAIGFFSLTFSESPPFAHLGIISGTGAILAWLLSISLLPALLVLLPWRAGSENLLIPTDWWRRLHAAIEPRAGKICVTVFIAGTVLAGFAMSNVLDDRYVGYFDKSFDFRRDTDYLNRHLGGFYNLEYSLASGRAEGVTQPAYLQQVDAFASWFRTQPGVTHVAAFSDIMRTVNQGMTGGDQAAYRLPEDAALAAQFLWLYEMSLPQGLDLREQITVDKSASRMTVALEELSTREVLALAGRARHWAQQNTPLLADSAKATGTTILFSHIGQRNIEQMLGGTFGALLLISAILFLVFRSIRLGTAAILTNLIPPLAALGGWALVVGEVGMAVATIAAVTLGIVVDDTIHFIEAAQRARRRGGKDASQAVLAAMTQAGPGIVITSVVLAAGFACLAFSGFQINAWMGLMTAIVICIAFVFDFLFLPALLIKLRRWT